MRTQVYSLGKFRTIVESCAHVHLVRADLNEHMAHLKVIVRKNQGERLQMFYMGLNRDRTRCPEEEFNSLVNDIKEREAMQLSARQQNS